MLFTNRHVGYFDQPDVVYALISGHGPRVRAQGDQRGAKKFTSGVHGAVYMPMLPSRHPLLEIFIIFSKFPIFIGSFISLEAIIDGLFSYSYRKSESFAYLLPLSFHILAIFLFLFGTHFVSLH
ncbi:hypothetical protein F4861DRAFT_333161 [Xylaria intraflava]|nr:hypothetical protein F4861DRAFT_333161 [Xylaria intraflava]